MLSDGNAIRTASPARDLAVGDHRLARFQTVFRFRPEDPIMLAIGEIHKNGLLQLDDAGFLKAKPGVMGSNLRIPPGRFA